MKKKWFWITMILMSLTVILIATSYVFSETEEIILTEKIRSSVPGQFVELSNGVVHYEYPGSGNKPTVILIHGFSVPYYIWDLTINDLVDNGFGVIRYDLYGRGYSDRPNVEYDLDLYVDQLMELQNFLNVDQQVNLIGLSQGAAVVAAYANRNPDQIQSITLVDPMIASVEQKDIFPLNVPIVGEYIAKVILIPHMLPQSQVNDFYHPEKFPYWEEKFRDQIQYIGFREAILSSIRNLVHVNPLAEYQALEDHNIPFLIIWGQEDQTISYIEIELLLNVVPDAEFHSIEEAGHISHYEQSEVVNSILIKFLSNDH